MKTPYFKEHKIKLSVMVANLRVSPNLKIEKTKPKRVIDSKNILALKI